MSLLEETSETEPPYWCSGCEHESVTPRLVYEHTHCGHIDFEESFKDEHGFTCPHCDNIEDTESVKNVGVILRCTTCGQMFDNLSESTR